jgi:glycosyltransferase involved in cell wall biosynthesis
MNLKNVEVEKTFPGGNGIKNYNDLKSSAGIPTLKDVYPKPNLICFSHLRWDFVFQRPQHLLTRFSKEINVFFIEEPNYVDSIEEDFLEVSRREPNIVLVVPVLRRGRSFEEVEAVQAELIEQYIIENQLEDFIAWYYTPMALGFTSRLKPIATVYDCMDELSAFAGAHPELLPREIKLLRQADLVFTGGYSLYEAKKNLHESVYAFPSSIEAEHFGVARSIVNDPEDQKNIPSPRIGFFGVIDERMDIELVGSVARMRPDWHFIFLGPTAKINPDHLPKEANIHYLGMKSYKELPSYLSGWDVAMLPFALNESTKFISPTKTPEYLAAGKPVVSSAVRDVVQSYGNKGLVNIFHNADSFVASVEKALKQRDDKEWLKKVDADLSTNSWDLTQRKMSSLIAEKVLSNR